MTTARIVNVIDDDADVRLSVCALVSSMHCDAKGFESAEQFLASSAAESRGVAVIDLRMTGMNGLELQSEMARRNPLMPLIFLTAHARTATTVQAMRAGALVMIDKPYHDNDLWDAIRKALEQEEANWIEHARKREIQDRLASLTPEEKQVADLMILGRANKVVAMELKISMRTVEKRRHNVLEKMGVDSVAELVATVLSAGSSGPKLPS
jgi:FixJ family two-component response regulator